MWSVYKLFNLCALLRLSVIIYWFYNAYLRSLWVISVFHNCTEICKEVWLYWTFCCRPDESHSGALETFLWGVVWVTARILNAFIGSSKKYSDLLKTVAKYLMTDVSSIQMISSAVLHIANVFERWQGPANVVGHRKTSTSLVLLSVYCV